MRKRFLSALLVICLILSLFPGMSQAVYITSGSCGENATWSFDEKTGTLTISGSGKMDDYHEISSPWNCHMCDTKSVVIDEGITSIGNYAFAGSFRLTGVSLPSTLESIGDRTFEDCGALSAVTIPQNLKTIGQRAFFMCHKLESIELPASVTSIGERAFYNVALTGIWVDPENAFYSSDENGVLFNKSKTKLIHAPSMLQGEYSIPESVTIIENFAFLGCGITAVTIPQGVTTVGYGAFEWCEELSQIRFPASVNSIGGRAFNGCTSLISIVFAGNAPYIDDDVFTKVTATAYYPEGNETWTSLVMQNCNGSITWVSYTPAPFTDVPLEKYYYVPVVWAYTNGITTGTSATAFSPDRECTRGQIVTFLWRAAGEPEPTITENPFTDVEEDDFYYKAVLWAVEKGITNGASATTFNPKGACDRAQVVTFMWRAVGKLSPTSANNPFVDVPEGKYYHDAVLWAVEQEITNGTSPTKFSPDSICNRGQIVTFLYRGYAQ